MPKFVVEFRLDGDSQDGVPAPREFSAEDIPQRHAVLQIDGTNWKVIGECWRQTEPGLLGRVITVSERIRPERPSKKKSPRG